MSVKYFGSDALNKLIDLVKTALGLKADDSNVVHKTGAETVAGNKTFTGTTIFSNANNNAPVRVKGDTNLNDAYVGFYDRSNNNLGFMGVKSDNLPYFGYGNSDKRLALLSETLPVFGSNDVSSNDCNTWTDKGVYQGLNVTNSPVTGWITVVTIPAGNENANYCEQRLFVTASNNTYSRYRVNGTWSSWVTTSQIYTLTTGWITLENYTWTRSAGGAYYVSGGIDIGLSSGNTIISITMADWSTISANYVIQPYRSGNGSKIGLMSNTDSFNDNSALKFIVAYV